MTRTDRRPDELRPVKITPGFLENPAGSALIETGKTRVLCTAMVEEKVPGWMRGDDDSTKGWLTSSYNMLPGSGDSRIGRETRGPRGRTQEIQRLIGRSLRTAVDLNRMGQRTIWIDCDVLQADGGTRTASITGAWVALKLAVKKLMDDGLLERDPVIRQIAATSVGIVKGEALLDLCYVDDSAADVDMNVVMDGEGNFIEVQATGEEAVFSREQMDALLLLAGKGVGELMEAQNRVLKE